MNHAVGLAGLPLAAGPAEGREARNANAPHGRRIADPDRAGVDARRVPRRTAARPGGHESREDGRRVSSGGRTSGQDAGPTITALLDDGPLRGERIEAQVVE